MIKIKQAIIKIDGWINTKLDGLAWYNKLAIIFLAGILARLFTGWLR